MMIIVDSISRRSLRVGSVLDWLLLILLWWLLWVTLISVGILAVGRGRGILVICLAHWWSYFPDNI